MKTNIVVSCPTIYDMHFKSIEARRIIKINERCFYDFLISIRRITKGEIKYGNNTI